MSRNNEDKVSGVQVVGYGHPTIFVIEDVKAGAVAVTVDGAVWQFDTAKTANRGLTECLPMYLKSGAIKWQAGRLVREVNQLVMPKPVVHPSQEAFATATARFEGPDRPATKSPDFSAGFGQAVVDHAAKAAKAASLEKRVADLEATMRRVKNAVNRLNYLEIMKSSR